MNIAWKELDRTREQLRSVRWVDWQQRCFHFVYFATSSARRKRSSRCTQATQMLFAGLTVNYQVFNSRPIVGESHYSQSGK